jgi:hypothetical protein
MKELFWYGIFTEVLWRRRISLLDYIQGEDSKPRLNVF